jgi:hypothetical protein
VIRKKGDQIKVALEMEIYVYKIYLCKKMLKYNIEAMYCGY